MYTLHTRFKKEIAAEFLPALSSSKGRPPKIIILLSGMPSIPYKKELMEFLARKGYWVFFPRYRGSWESGGRFLKFSPEKDVLDILDELPKGFKDIYNRKTYTIKPRQIVLLGSSFGGPAAILASRDPRVSKAIVISPVVDWRAQSKTEPIDWMRTFVREAFGEGYRFSDKDWNKLKTGTFFNPTAHAGEIDGRKLLIIHAKDDDVVAWKPVAKFAHQTNSTLWLRTNGGHLSTTRLLNPQFYKRVKKFLNKSL